MIGSITADITRAQNAAGESALGDVIADAQLADTRPANKGNAVVAFMNPGGIRTDLIFNQISGGERRVRSRTASRSRCSRSATR